MTRQGRGRCWIGIAGSVFLLLSAVFLYRDFLSLSHLGHDSYPIIIAARIENGSDLLGTFTEELMDGRYPPGHFYRPVLNLSFALDHAIWGLRPFGYHLTDLIVLILSTLLLARLLPRMGGRALAAAGIAAGVFFLVHPIHLNVLPVPPRRGDTLALLFMLLALHAGRGRRPYGVLLPPLFTLLAVGAKETGAITPLLLFSWRFLLPDEGTPSRLRQAISASLPSFLIVIPFLVVRQVVIGGLGGHMELTVAKLFHNAIVTLPEFQRGTFYPFHFLSGIVRPAIARSTIVIALLAVSPFLLRKGSTREIGIFTLAWFLFGWSIHAFSGSISPWYALHTTAPFSIFAGLVLYETASAFRGAEALRKRIAGGIGTLVIVTLFIVNLRGAPPFRIYPEWQDLSILTNLFLENLEQELSGAQAGTTISMDGLPWGAKYRRGSPIVIAAGLTDYTVQAWVDMVFPDRKIRVAMANPPPAAAEKDEILVTVEVGRGNPR